MQVQVFLDDDLGIVKGNGNEIVSFPWSLNNSNGTPGTLQLAALNFYGTNFSNTSGTYHIDDITITELPPPLAVASDNKNTPTFFPNPAQNFFVVGGLDATNCELLITDLSGKMFMHNLLNAANNVVDVSVLDAGIYLVTIEKENSRLVKKLVVQ